MDHRRDVFGFFVLFVLVVFFGAESRGQSCELNFHLESSSVMLLPGDNASVLCDASCFGREAGVHVIWRDAFGRQLGLQPSRVFSVRYNYGLMNRIMMIRASQQTVGTYVCTLMRSEEVLQQKPMNFVLLEDTGPRRGDISPERDMDYRPVRSVDRALSRVDTGYPTLDQTAKQNDHHKDLRQQSREKSSVIDEDSYLVRSFEKLNNIYNRNKQSRNVINEIQNEKDMLREATHKDLVERRFMSARNTLKSLFSIMHLKQNKSDNLIDAQKIRPDNSDLPTLEKLHNEDHSYKGYLRVRRQNTNQMSTEQPTTRAIETTSTSTVGVSEGNTSAEPQTQPSATPSNHSSDATSSTDEASGDGEISTTQPTEKADTKTSSITSAEIVSTQPTEKADTKTSSVTSDYMYEDSTPCQGIHSNFGRYGVLAFSVTLAVAFLLLYAILMIIFMPKIMARRKEKSNIEAGAYRKTGPDTSDTAPLTVLDGLDVEDDDVAKQDTNVDYTAVQKDKTGDVEKEEASTEATAAVSSFLLRQNSEKTTGQPNKGEETKEDSKASDEGNNLPQSNTTTAVVSPSEPNHAGTPSATPPMNHAPAVSSTTQQTSDFMGDFRISDFMSTPTGQSDATNSNDGKSEVAKNSSEPITGKSTGTSDDHEVDLLPPPPPGPSNV